MERSSTSIPPDVHPRTAWNENNGPRGLLSVSFPEALHLPMSDLDFGAG